MKNALYFLLTNVNLFLVIRVLSISFVELHGWHVQEQSLKVERGQHYELGSVNFVFSVLYSKANPKLIIVNLVLSFNWFLYSLFESHIIKGLAHYSQALILRVILDAP